MKSKKLLFLLMSVSAALTVSAQIGYPRGILFETFTGQECASCSVGTQSLKDLYSEYEDNERFVWLSHHAGYYSDSLTIKPSFDISSFCGVSAAPSLVYNRTLLALTGRKGRLINSCNDFAEYNEKYEEYYGETFIDNELATLADVSLNIKTTYDKDTRDLEVTVFGEKNGNFDASAPALSIFLVSDYWVGWQTRGSEGQDFAYKHMNPVRIMLSDHYLGDMLEFDENGEYSVTINCKVPTSVNSFDAWTNRIGSVPTEVDDETLYVAAFIANRDETPVDNINYDRDNIVVYNAARCSLGESTRLSVRDCGVTESDNVRVYADNGNVCVDGDFESFQVYSLAGSAVEPTALDKGIYLVKVNLGGGTVTKKLVVR